MPFFSMQSGTLKLTHSAQAGAARVFGLLFGLILGTREHSRQPAEAASSQGVAAAHIACLLSCGPARAEPAENTAAACSHAQSLLKGLLLLLA